MDEYVKSDVSRKRKWDCDGEMEAESDGQMSVKRHESVIETNQQFDAGRVEPEKEKNPQLKLRQRHQPETVNQHEMDNEMGEEKTIILKNYSERVLGPTPDN